MRFGRLTVIDSAAGESGWSTKRLLCKCDCGTTKRVMGSYLGKNSTSCGCFQRELTSRRSATHGRTGTTEYAIWRGMIQRCHSVGHKDYPNYGARGITVCERWRKSFAAFLADVGERPAGMTIDRINNDGGYELSNCRWATQIQQQQNRRSTRLTPDTVREIRQRFAAGERKASLARRFGVTFMTITYVVRKTTWSNVQ